VPTIGGAHDHGNHRRGNIGGALARHLVRGGERVVLAGAGVASSRPYRTETHDDQQTDSHAAGRIHALLFTTLWEGARRSCTHRRLPRSPYRVRSVLLCAL
jgi:NAD(P)-dependent dehydrogenase (short-subunit alcohol dehydrogenase family)